MLFFAVALSGCAAPTPPTLRLAAPPATVTGPVLAVGGDLNLGRCQNALTAMAGPGAALGALPALTTADLTYANLECVVARGGDTMVDKGAPGPYYFRARPETAEVLHAAGVDVVGTANNHAGDYGPGALLEEAAILDGMGIAHPGSGPTRAAACAPVYRHAGALAVAFVSVDATMPRFAATDSRAGTCGLPLGDPRVWKAFAEAAVAEARPHADLVFLGVHWGSNGLTAPTKAVRTAAKAAIRGGFDGVLGSHAHLA